MNLPASFQARFRAGAISVALITGSLVLLADPVLASHNCAGSAATIHGTSGSDNISGTPGNDVIHGLGGNDQIFGLGGDDLICGGPGNDNLNGGDGNDGLIGDNTASGSRPLGGNDSLDGGIGGDSLIGDYLAPSGTSITAPGGADSFVDPDGMFIVIGDNFAESGSARGAGGRDTIRVEATLLAVGDNSGRGAGGNGGLDILEFRVGVAVAIGDNQSTNTSFPAAGQGSTDTFTGSAGNERFWGDNATCNSLLSSGCASTGGGGRDRILAGAGNDTLRGGPNIDHCDGGPGTDSAPDGDCEDQVNIP